MTVKELQGKSPVELTRLLAEQREHLRDLRFKASQGQLKDVRDIRVARQTIARLLTILRASKSSS